MKILIVDHGAGNLVSMAQALTAAGAEPLLVDSRAQIEAAQDENPSGMVLPGVGSTGAAMERLVAQDLVEPIRSWAQPLLGVCVGMQLFFEHSEEDNTECLGLLGGSVKRLTHRRLPHMGWNDLNLLSPDPLFEGITDEPFYFVHSYAPQVARSEVLVATADYDGPVTAAVRSRNLVGVQFHPERSGAAGRQVMTNFVRSCERVGIAS